MLYFVQRPSDAAIPYLLPTPTSSTRSVFPALSTSGRPIRALDRPNAKTSTTALHVTWPTTPSNMPNERTDASRHRVGTIVRRRCSPSTVPRPPCSHTVTPPPTRSRPRLLLMQSSATWSPSSGGWSVIAVGGPYRSDSIERGMLFRSAPPMASPRQRATVITPTCEGDSFNRGMRRRPLLKQILRGGTGLHGWDGVIDGRTATTRGGRGGEGSGLDSHRYGSIFVIEISVVYAIHSWPRE